MANTRELLFSANLIHEYEISRELISTSQFSRAPLGGFVLDHNHIIKTKIHISGFAKMKQICVN